MQYDIKNKTLFILTGLILAGNGCAARPTHPLAPPSRPETIYDYSQKLTVGTKQLLVEVADSNEKRARGLAGRPPLTETQGMLFDFRGTNQTKPAFWMKGMRFDLDIIWIKDFTIIGITKNVPAPKSKTDALPNHFPPSEIDMVLEVNAGWSDRYGITIGDLVQLN